MSIRQRTIWLMFHRWAGLILGVVLSILGVTGTILVFDAEIDAALNPSLMKVTPAGDIKPFDDIVKAAAAAYPGTTPRYFERRSDAVDEAFKVVLRSPSGEEVQTFVDPYTLAVLGERSGLSGVALARQIHGYLLMGDFGRNLVGALSIVFIFFFIAGLVLWWPSKGGFGRALSVKWTSEPPRLMRELHNVVGAPLFVFLMAATVTVPPIVWKFTSPANAPAAGGPPGGRGGEQAAPVNRTPISWQQAADVAAAQVPGQYVGFTLLNEGARPLYMVRFWPKGQVATVSEMTNVFIEPYSGRFLRAQGPAEFTALSLVQADFAANIHSGFVAGMPGRIIMALAGIAFPVLFVTGLALCMLKRRRLP